MNTWREKGACAMNTIRETKPGAEPMANNSGWRDVYGVVDRCENIPYFKKAMLKLQHRLLWDGWDVSMIW